MPLQALEGSEIVVSDSGYPYRYFAETDTVHMDVGSVAYWEEPIEEPPPIQATGAVAGTPGTFTPAGAVPPADVAGMTGLTATPATPWTVGQYVQTATAGAAGEASWNGTTWVTGRVP